jgi:hypothetical protein
LTIELKDTNGKHQIINTACIVIFRAYNIKITWTAREMRLAIFMFAAIPNKFTLTFSIAIVFLFLRPSARCAKVFQLSRKFITQEVRAINSLRGELQRMGLGGKLGPWKQLTSGGHAILLFNKVTPIPVTIPYVKTMLELPDTTFQESTGSYNSFDLCSTAIFALLASTSKLF